MPSHICIAYNQAELQSTDWQCIYLTNWKSTGKARAGHIWRSEDKKDVNKLRGPEKSRRMIPYLRIHELQRKEKPIGPSQLKKDWSRTQ